MPREPPASRTARTARMVSRAALKFQARGPVKPCVRCGVETAARKGVSCGEYLCGNRVCHDCKVPCHCLEDLREGLVGRGLTCSIPFNCGCTPMVNCCECGKAAVEEDTFEWSKCLGEVVAHKRGHNHPTKVFDKDNTGTKKACKGCALFDCKTEHFCKWAVSVSKKEDLLAPCSALKSCSAPPPPWILAKRRACLEKVRLDYNAFAEECLRLVVKAR